MAEGEQEKSETSTEAETQPASETETTSGTEEGQEEQSQTLQSQPTQNQMEAPADPLLQDLSMADLISKSLEGLWW